MFAAPLSLQGSILYGVRHSVYPSLASSTVSGRLTSAEVCLTFCLLLRTERILSNCPVLVGYGWSIKWFCCLQLKEAVQNNQGYASLILPKRTVHVNAFQAKHVRL